MDIEFIQDEKNLSEIYDNIEFHSYNNDVKFEEQLIYINDKPNFPDYFKNITIEFVQNTELLKLEIIINDVILESVIFKNRGIKKYKLINFAKYYLPYKFCTKFEIKFKGKPAPINYKINFNYRNMEEFINHAIKYYKPCMDIIHKKYKFMYAIYDQIGFSPEKIDSRSIQYVNGENKYMIKITKDLIKKGYFNKIRNLVHPPIFDCYRIMLLTYSEEYYYDHIQQYIIINKQKFDEDNKFAYKEKLSNSPPINKHRLNYDYLIESLNSEVIELITDEKIIQQVLIKTNLAIKRLFNIMHKKKEEVKLYRSIAS